MKKIIVFLSVLIYVAVFAGCAQSLWIVKDYDARSGKIRYLDAEDKEHAFGQAAAWCAPAKPHLVREGHYHSLFVAGLGGVKESPFMFIEFVCQEGKVTKSE